MDNDEVGIENVRALDELSILAGDEIEAAPSKILISKVEEDGEDLLSDTISVASEELEVNIVEKLGKISTPL